MLGILLILMLTGLSESLASEGEGTIAGRIVDRITKQPIPGANIIVLSTNRGTSSDSAGNFRIVGVPENVYQLRVSHFSYHPTVMSDVRVIRNKTTHTGEIELLERTVEIGEITVTPEKFSSDLVSPLSHHEYSQEEIWRAPGAVGDIFRAIEVLPGVASSGGEFSAFSVRGGGPRDNIILVDNIPFDKVSHFDGGNEGEEAQGGRFSIFAPRVINRATLLAGGFPARFGGKHSSVLDLTIREGNRENLTLDASLDFVGGELNYSGPSFADRSTSVLVSARYANLERVLRIVGQRDRGVPEYADIIVKTSTALGGHHSVSLLWIYAPEFFTRTAKHVLESDQFNETRLNDHRETKALAGVNWRWLIGASSVLQSTLYYRSNVRRSHTGKAYPDLVKGEPLTGSNLPVRPNIYEEDQKEYDLGVRTGLTLQ